MPGRLSDTIDLEPLPSGYQIVDRSHNKIPRRILADRECIEVRLSAFDLRALLVTKIVRKEAALGLDHEVQPLRAVLLHQHCPVGVVGTEGRGDFEPTGELRVDLDCGPRAALAR